MGLELEKPSEEAMTDVIDEASLDLKDLLAHLVRINNEVIKRLDDIVFLLEDNDNDDEDEDDDYDDTTFPDHVRMQLAASQAKTNVAEAAMWSIIAIAFVAMVVLVSIFGS